MESVELYRQLLGLTAPWAVERVELDMAKGRVEVYVGHLAGQRFACPECAQELAVYDHLPQRSWRHLPRRAAQPLFDLRDLTDRFCVAV